MKTRRSSPLTRGLRRASVLLRTTDARVVGSVLNSVFVAPSSPIANGYGIHLPVISANGMVFNVSNTLGRDGGTRADGSL